MTRLRICATVLAGAFLMSATACGSDDEPTPTAAANPPAATTAAPAATTPAADAAGGGASDKELCETASKADAQMRKEVVAVFQSGKEPDAAFFKKIYSEMAEQLKTTGDGAVADAMNGFAAESAKIAAEENPSEDNPALEKAGRDLNAACKTAGVKLNY